MKPHTHLQRNYWNKEVNEFDSIYSQEKSKISNYLDSVFRWDMFARFEYTMEYSEPIENHTFIDIGCGTGRYAIELGRKKARLVVGIDIAEAMIKTCQERAKQEHLENRCIFIQGDPLEYQNSETFDVSIGIGLFDYIKDALPMLKKMRELTKDKAILSFPRLYTWRAPVRKIRLGLKGCFVRFYHKTEIIHLLQSAGFNRVEIHKIGQLYCVTAYINEK
ncbi:MAG: methyltransferase domain-containing protein [bacterium]